MFSCNKPICLYKRQTQVSNYCKLQLISDIQKNPGPTPVYIDPSKTVTAPSLCHLIYNNKQGINSANHQVSIMNILPVCNSATCFSSTFYTNCYAISLRVARVNACRHLVYNWTLNSSFQCIQKGSPIHGVDSLVVDIVMPTYSLNESDPLKFISTESLPDSNGSNLDGCIWTFPSQNSRFWPILSID